jgi:dTDP-glucose 4,6-dehydratase
MAIWLWRILLDGKPGGVYDVGGIRPVALRQLAREIAKHTGAKLEPFEADDPRPYYVPAHARETMLELGVEEYTSFEDGVQKTVEHYREALNAR